MLITRMPTKAAATARARGRRGEAAGDGRDRGGGGGRVRRLVRIGFRVSGFECPVDKVRSGTIDPRDTTVQGMESGVWGLGFRI